MGTPWKGPFLALFECDINCFQVKGFNEARVGDIFQRCSVEPFYKTTKCLAPKAVYTNAIFPLDNGWLVNLWFESPAPISNIHLVAGITMLRLKREVCED